MVSAEWLAGWRAGLAAAEKAVDAEEVGSDETVDLAYRIAWAIRTLSPPEETP